MFATTRTHDSRLASAISKGKLVDARSFERRNATKALRRAGKVSVCEALDECEDARDDMYEIRNAVDRAEAMEDDLESIRVLAELAGL